MTKNVIREMQREQEERNRVRAARIFGIFTPDPIADAWLAAIAADSSVRERLSPADQASLDAYAKARETAQKEQGAA